MIIGYLRTSVWHEDKVSIKAQRALVLEQATTGVNIEVCMINKFLIEKLNYWRRTNIE